jgi:hypothetical protein
MQSAPVMPSNIVTELYRIDRSRFVGRFAGVLTQTDVSQRRETEVVVAVMEPGLKRTLADRHYYDECPRTRISPT